MNKALLLKPVLQLLRNHTAKKATCNGQSAALEVNYTADQKKCTALKDQ